jgi:tripeptide aminopeptidase
MNAARLLERFLRYVQIDTTANPATDAYPSSPGQWELGRVLVEELRAAGLADAEQDAHGLVYATLPASVQRDVPTIALCAHLDTSPETSGRGVRPIVWRDYAGGDLTLPGDPRQVLRVAANPELRDVVGHTLITSDGTTLLGADDKAGLAVIVETVASLAERPEAPHGPIRLVLTCDEEIGRGVDHVDLVRVGAAACYTLDGAGTNEIDVETFSADLAVVRVTGVNIHPSIGRGRMVNAVRAAAEFVARLPRDHLAPEAAAGREGFLHPYLVEGGVAQTTLHVLLRDFETERLAEQRALMEAAGREVERAFPGAAVAIDITRQYRNLREGLAREPRAVAFAEQAHRRLGREPRRTIIRGGTDGSRLTELGLPTPNLSTGEHNPHSPLEWTSLQEMVAAGEVVEMLAQVWAE